MTKKTTEHTTFANIRVDAETHALLSLIKEQDGVPFAAQINRAMKLYAAQKGITIPRSGK